MTTQALDDAGHRISRNLRAQVMVNASFGFAIGVGLYFIGIPNAVFWGLLGMVLRFLPYIGAWIAVALPLALSVALFQSWTQPVLTVVLFAVCEVGVANVVEPWLYGATTEISPLAVKPAPQPRSAPKQAGNEIANGLKIIDDQNGFLRIIAVRGE